MYQLISYFILSLNSSSEHHPLIPSLYSFCLLIFAPPFSPPTRLFQLNLARITSDLGLKASVCPPIQDTEVVTWLWALACTLLRVDWNEWRWHTHTHLPFRSIQARLALCTSVLLHPCGKADHCLLFFPIQSSQISFAWQSMASLTVQVPAVFLWKKGS